ncbi:MAG TPA: hypothetical protein VNH43_02115, partial [Vicinamibacteria bacterium]|nr:hypothetical protein [Vicinamibacteria bacterium]
MRSSVLAVLAVAALVAGCRSPDPRSVAEVSDTETYWAIDNAQGERQFIAPVVRFKIHNKV